MAAKKGAKRAAGAGRKAGVPNKQTTIVKEAILKAYEVIGGDIAFAAWARENPTIYYQHLWAKVMPIQVHNTGTAPPTILWPLAPGPLDD